MKSKINILHKDISGINRVLKTIINSQNNNIFWLNSPLENI